MVGLLSPAYDAHDGAGKPVPGLDAVDLIARMVGPFLVYVPDFRFLGGSIGVIGVLPAGQQCGQLVLAIPSRCTSGFADPYIEVAWSRFFGQIRRSREANAFPIMEGLSIGLGVGVVLPIGHYNPGTQALNGVTIGNNTFDIAPSIAVTYTTPPLILEGTEFSAKLYWNNYGANPVTQYRAGSLLNVDFAVSERFGRFQVGVAGFYAVQVADDRQFGVVLPPDGRQAELLNFGGVVNYDMPELGMSIRMKALTTLIARNAVTSNALVLGFAKKLY